MGRWQQTTGISQTTVNAVRIPSPERVRCPPLPSHTLMNKLTLLALASLGLASAASATSLFGVTADNQLVSFDSANPTSITSSVQISGLFQSDGTTANPLGSLVNITYNYNDGQLYGIDNNANFYRVGTNGSTTLLSSSIAPNGFNSGLGFDPFFGNLVYGTDANEKFTLGSNGSILGSSTFNYATGDLHDLATPSIVGLTFDPAFGTAYFLDAELNTLSLAIDPGLQELQTIGDLGIDIAGFGGLAIDFDGNLFAALSTDGLTTKLYQIDTNTGAATLIPGGNPNLVAIAVPEPSAALLGALGTLALLRRRRA